MQLRRRLRPSLLFLFSVLSLLSGCGSGGGIYANYRSLSELETVSTLGLDRASDGLILSASADRGGEESAPTVLCRHGQDLRQGLDALQHYAADRQLFFAHTSFLLLGDAFARDGIGQVLDYVERDVNTRMAAKLFVLRDARADALITAGGDVSALLASVVRDTKSDCSSHVSDLRSIAVSLSEYGAAAVCALRMTPTEGSVFSDGAERIAVPDGYAILRDGALAAYVDGTAAEALSFLAGRPGAVVREFAEGVTLELRRAGSPSFHVRETADGLSAEVTLRLNAAYSVVDTPGQDRALPDATTLEARVSAAVKEDAESVLAVSRALNADFLALGKLVRRRIGPAAQKDFLQRTEFHVNVEVVMDHSYDMGAPLNVSGGGS